MEDKAGGLVLPSPTKLRKVFKVDALSLDFGAGNSKKSYKMGLDGAKYS
jgi:hypothetical protein